MYACTEIFTIIFEKVNLIGGGTCRNDRIGLPGNDERLTFSRGAERGTYMRLYNRRFHLVATIYKYSKTMHLISSLSETGIAEGPMRRVQDIHQVVFPEDLTKYHQNMDGADRGDQGSTVLTSLPKHTLKVVQVWELRFV